MADSTAVRRFDIPRVERVLEGPDALTARVEEVGQSPAAARSSSRSWEIV